MTDSGSGQPPQEQVVAWARDPGEVGHELVEMPPSRPESFQSLTGDIGDRRFDVEYRARAQAAYASQPHPEQPRGHWEDRPLDRGVLREEYEHSVFTSDQSAPNQSSSSSGGLTMPPTRRGGRGGGGGAQRGGAGARAGAPAAADQPPPQAVLPSNTDVVVFDAGTQGPAAQSGRRASGAGRAHHHARTAAAASGSGHRRNPRTGSVFFEGEANTAPVPDLSLVPYTPQEPMQLPPAHVRERQHSHHHSRDRHGRERRNSGSGQRKHRDNSGCC